MIYRIRENFGGGNFWQIITAEAIGEEIFGDSAGSLSVITLYLRIILAIAFASKIFPHTVFVAHDIVS